MRRCGAASSPLRSRPARLAPAVLVMAKQTRFETEVASGPGLLQLEDDNDLQGAEKKRKKSLRSGCYRNVVSTTSACTNLTCPMPSPF